MHKLLILTSAIALLATLIGLIKPKFVFMPNRKTSTITYLILFFVTARYGMKIGNEGTTGNATKIDQVHMQSPNSKSLSKKFEYGDLTLAEYKNKSVNTRSNIVTSYLEHKQLPNSNAHLFYNCMSEMSYQNSQDLSLNEAFSWCLADFNVDPDSFNKKINLDHFFATFNKRDGSYPPLEKIIKNSMNDDDSYKHVKTTYILMLNMDPPYAIISSTIRGKNVYGAVVKNKITVKVDVATGAIIEILSQE